MVLCRLLCNNEREFKTAEKKYEGTAFLCFRVLSIADIACRLIAGVKQDNSYDDIKINKVYERKNADYASGFDYYTVPDLYFDRIKMHEGDTERQDIERVMKKCMRPKIKNAIYKISAHQKYRPWYDYKGNVF